MAASAPGKITSPKGSPRRRLAAKFGALVLLAILLGFAQDWTASRFYGAERVAGFHLGVIQGALMPAALPALLMGKDVPIYAPSNEGRFYKIGYIMGINLCGTIFFGLALWQPRRQST